MAEPSLASILPPELALLKWQPLFSFFIEVKKPFVVGKIPLGDRRIGEIPGGRFEGERLRGKILSSGSDWQTVRDELAAILALLK